MRNYILNPDKSVTLAKSMQEWLRWDYSTEDKHVGVTNIKGVRVSTVFLGIDHNFWGGPPLLFETMVFNGELDQEQERYSTWDEAVFGHAVMVKRVQKGEKKDAT